MITGVVVARRAFVEENPEAVAAFLEEYAASTAFVNENPAEAAVWIGELGIATAEVAEQAIPACNIVCITGEEMQEKVSGYLEAVSYTHLDVYKRQFSDRTLIVISHDPFPGKDCDRRVEVGQKSSGIKSTF